VSPAAADPPASYRAIENLIAAYAELVDDGDFTLLAALLAEAACRAVR
jgi:3-phenylpropionate/cinnamic acid dioxygenase small subunit